MLGWALIFFVLALAAAVLGFGGFVAGSLLWVAKVCVVVFLILFVLSLVFGRPYNDPTVGPPY